MGESSFFTANPNLPQYTLYVFEFPKMNGIGAVFGDDTGELVIPVIANYIKSTFGTEPTPNYKDCSVTFTIMGYLINYSLAYSKDNHYPMAERVVLATDVRKYYDKSGILVE